MRWHVIATLELREVKDEFFVDIGLPIRPAGITKRKAGAAKRKRTTEAAPGLDECFGLELGVSRSASRGLGKYPAGHALRHCRRVAAGY